jgi:membrane-associated phospholipid phosphatase
MNFLLQSGIGWIVAIQALGRWLELPMKFFSFWDYGHFFIIVLPLIYWSVDAGVGLRIAIVLATSNYFNGIFKLLFAAPRPYWISARVKFFGTQSGDTSFGLPSGHAQVASASLGVIAAWVNKRWAWVAAFVLTFFIGFSRLYLGVHFVHDVLAGWLIGYAILFMFLRFWDPVAAWLKTKTPVQQVLIAFVISLLLIAIGAWTSAHLAGYVFPVEWRDNALRAGPLPDPVTLENVFSSTGSLFGLAVGAAWIASRGGYQVSGPMEKRFLCYVIGMLGTMILWFGSERVFPHARTLIPLIWHYIRYSLLGFWVMGGAPWLFIHFKLSGKPDTVVSPRNISEEVLL